MHTSRYQIRRSTLSQDVGLPSVSSTVAEANKKMQTELDLWREAVHEDALHAAAQRGGPITFGGVEAMLRLVSEQVTRAAQERLRQQAHE